VVVSAEVVLYSRAGCHLCEDALQVLERVRDELEFELVVRDIDASDELQRAYLERIPVIAVDGHEWFQFFVEERALRERLQSLA
jgi:glutaredoxin